MKLKETIVLKSEKITACINGEKCIGEYIGWPIIEKNGAIYQRIIFKKI